MTLILEIVAALVIFFWVLPAAIEWFFDLIALLIENWKTVAIFVAIGIGIVALAASR